MKHNPPEFVRYVADHFRPIEAMCRERVRFSRDDEIAAFLHRFEEDDKNVTRLIGRMREVGVLRELAGLWSPPPFLMKFLEGLEARSALASRKVIQGWVEALRCEHNDWCGIVAESRAMVASVGVGSVALGGGPEAVPACETGRSYLLRCPSCHFTIRSSSSGRDSAA